MKLTAKLSNISKIEKLLVTFEVMDNVTDFSEIEGFPLSLEVKKQRKDRSLNANAYAWALMSEIADYLGLSKEEVYEDMLKKYGTTDTDDNGVSLVISVLSNIDISKAGFHFAKIGTGKVGGKDFTHYRIVKGSSQYDTKEMSIFLNGVVEEAEGLGISTKNSEELERLVKNVR